MPVKPCISNAKTFPASSCWPAERRAGRVYILWTSSTTFQERAKRKRSTLRCYQTRSPSYTYLPISWLVFSLNQRVARLVQQSLLLPLYSTLFFSWKSSPPLTAGNLCSCGLFGILWTTVQCFRLWNSQCRVELSHWAVANRRLYVIDCAAWMRANLISVKR